MNNTDRSEDQLLDELARLRRRNAELEAMEADRRRAEQAMRDSEERFHMLFEHSPDGIVLLDPNSPDGSWPIVDCNEAICRMNGYTREELIGQSIDILHEGPEDPARRAAYFKRLRREGTMKAESIHRRKDGTSFPIQFSTSLVTLDGKEMVLGIDRDITGRVQTEEELRKYREGLEELVSERTADLTQANEQLREEISRRKQTEETLRLLLKHVPATIAVFDREMNYVVTSRKWLEDYDLTEQEIIGRSHYEVVPDIPDRWKEIHRRCLAGAVEKCDEDPFPRADGSIDWIRWEIHPWYETAGEIGGIIMLAEDITERKQAGEELKAAHEHLQILSHAKAEFIERVTHELNTPITSIKLNHHMLTRAPDRLDTCLPRLQRETARLEQLVADLLEVSRLDREQIPLKPEPTDLNTLSRMAVTDRTPLAEERGLRLTFVEEPDLPAVQADQVLIERVLSILLSNALNYTPAGGGVTVRTQARRADGQDWAGFSIGDTGPGIPPDELPRLFERFFRGRVTLNTGTPGIGLGLAMAKEIVERHGGQVEVANVDTPGEGALFTVWIPVAT